MTETPLPTLEGIRRAAHELALHLPPTPLVRSEILSRALEGDVWLKLETASPIASFKLRGALNAILQAQARDGVPGVVTTSTGNHGQGVAYAARLLGLGAEIFLPHPANPVKKAMIQAFGGKVHEKGADLDQARDHALAHCAGHGGLYIDDGENLDVMEGAGTMGLEVAEALPDVGPILVPTGGGNAAPKGAVEYLGPPRGIEFSQAFGRIFRVAVRGPDTEPQRQNSARRGAGDHIEQTGDRRAGTRLDLGQDHGGDDAAYSAAIDREYFAHRHADFPGPASFWPPWLPPR